MYDLILLKEIVRKKLIANNIDISKVRIIKHGDWVDIYPKKPDYITVTNKRKSSRRNKDKPIIKDGAIRHIPVTQGRHTTDIPVRLYQFDKYAEDEDFNFMVETVKNYLKN
jgi:hypothetical protein